MNDLMIHTERIVRPVRASQRRKLRMRRELLAHLEAAVAEEREAGTPDAPAAVERAKRRLGAPEDLTRSLQQSVPIIERVLLGRVPAPRSLDRWEVRAVRRIWKTDRPRTLLHASILIGCTVACGYSAVLAVVTAFRPADYLARSVASLLSTALFNVVVTAMVLMMFVQAGRFATAIADADARSARRTFGHGACAVAFLVALMFACAGWVAGRPATPAEVGRSLVAGVCLVAVLSGVGMWLGRRGRAYEPWLAIDVAC